MVKCFGCFKDKIADGHCPYCGYQSIPNNGRLLLPEGTVLQNRYIIGRVLGKPGGFGITYLGFNQSLETLVAIKEYLPREMVGRCTNSLSLGAHSQEDTETFRNGLEQFLSEARMLAKFDHANIVRVIDFFEDNNTAYLVMHYYQGVNLTEYMNSKGGKLPEQAVIDIMMPILDGLREVHNHGILHRDIKPQNIYLAQSGRAILLDFGNARQALGERNKSLSVIMTPGFAPTEQYSRKGSQGPWTDIYGCAATMYYMLAGQVPTDALERVNGAPLTDITILEQNVSSVVGDAIMKGLALHGVERPQSIGDFQNLLLHNSPKVPVFLQANDALNDSQTVKLQQTQREKIVALEPTWVRHRSKITKKSVGILLAIFIAVVGYIAIPWGQPQPEVSSPAILVQPTVDTPTKTENPPQKDHVTKVQQYKQYTNARYGFTGDYPEDFTGTELPNGVGMQYISPDGQAKLMMYGSNYDGKDSIQKEYQHMVAEKGKNVGYHTAGDTWYVVSWEENGRAYYHKTLSSQGSTSSFEMYFPKQNKELYSDMITHLEANFIAGDLNKGYQSPANKNNKNNKKGG